ncbi:hypothetical protein EM20IM_08140 [Candidatus Methylacidiphilum infernorum]|uniref:Uncharacterized protein n=1 Tax=Candidatus Methylacidiphilum infernorum TaxID=511746 RepID=A0ABX7PUG5_9BACT|nr:hypothetical protein [Candidatus Methylacidiphilum infernorum]QSR86455.1 hypothetical protein EM20IM_08140 [Candidatus Methylacidiphilum infernorum]
MKVLFCLRIEKCPVSLILDDRSGFKGVGFRVGKNPRNIVTGLFTKDFLPGWLKSKDSSLVVSDPMLERSYSDPPSGLKSIMPTSSLSRFQLTRNYQGEKLFALSLLSPFPLGRRAWPTRISKSRSAT